MFLSADQMVANGGPSAPVWAFLTALTIGLLTIIGQQLKARSDLKRLRVETERAKSEASKAAQSASTAAESASKTEENTASIANGFASRMDRKLDRIITQQQTTQDSLTKHLEWHLNRGE